MVEWLRELAHVARSSVRRQTPGAVIALQCAVYCACGSASRSQPTAADTGGVSSKPDKSAASSDASGSSGNATVAGRAGVNGAGGASPAGAGAQTATPSAGAASSDPNVAVLDRTHWQSYPTVKFPAENPYSADKALLGKLLFWDEQLSSDNTVACGTCHRGAGGGSDPRPAQPGYVGNPGPDNVRGTADDRPGAKGIAMCQEDPNGGAPTPVEDKLFGHDPQVGRRRAMTVFDAMFWDSMFWDGRVKGTLIDPVSNQMLIASGAALEAQALAPIMNAAEMACKGRTWQLVEKKVAAAHPLALASNLPADLLSARESGTTYAELFNKVFGDNAVTAARIVMAIATYERTLTANQTPWDRWHEGDDAAMTDQEKRGFQLFAIKGNCSCCHTLPLFGLPQLIDDAFHLHSWDGGGAEMGMDKPGDYTNPTFRTVTVRNAGLREKSGLLHDGLDPGNSLENLIAAYNKAPVRNVHFCRHELKLTADEQADLIAFVRNALTDPRAAQEQAPFDRPTLASERSSDQLPSGSVDAGAPDAGG